MAAMKQAKQSGTWASGSEDQLTRGQVSFLTYASIVGNIVYTFTYVTFVTGRPFWIAVLIGVLVDIPFALWILRLGRRLEGGTVFDILETGLGRITGKIISKLIIILFIAVNIANAVCMVNLFAGTVKVFILQNTPSYITVFFIVLICTLFANSGLQTFGRWVQIMVVLYTINYFVGFSLSFVSVFKIDNILPIFDTTWANFGTGVLITAGTAAESLLFLMLIVGKMVPAQKYKLQVIKGFITWSVVLSVAVLIMEGCVGSELLSRIAQAGVSVSRLIKIHDFVRGMEILVLMTYQYLAIVKVTIFIYSCYESSKKLFNIKKSTILLIVSAVLIFVPSIYINQLNTGYYLSVFLGSYVILPFVVFVLILASISAVRMKKRGKLSK